MARFRALDEEFYGVNPALVVFQRQSFQDSCWAACLSNAASVLHGRPLCTDQDIIDRVGFYPGERRGLRKRHIKEWVNLVSNVSRVKERRFFYVSKSMKFGGEPDTPGEKAEMFGGVSANLKSENPFPFMVGLRWSGDSSEIVRHAVLLLAVNQDATRVLFYDPANSSESEGNLALATLQGRDRWGLVAVDSPTFVARVRFFMALQRTIG